MSDLTLHDESAASRISIRAAAGTSAASALGLSFGSAETRDGALVAKIRPDEWYVLGGDALIDSLDLTGFASRVEITHSRLQFRLTGAAAARVLEKLCNIDFSDHMTPNGACLGASVAQVSCDLVRDDVGDAGSRVRSYLLLCDSSYRDYFEGALTDAMQEFAT